VGWAKAKALKKRRQGAREPRSPKGTTQTDMRATVPELVQGQSPATAHAKKKKKILVVAKGKKEEHTARSGNNKFAGQVKGDKKSERKDIQ